MIRHIGWALLAVLLLSVVGLLLQGWMPGESPSAPLSVPSGDTTSNRLPTTPPPSTVVSAVHGIVEHFSAAKGRWETVAVGTTLNEDAVLRTRLGRAELLIGDSIKIVLNDDSQFRLREVSKTLSTVRVEGGRLTANIRGGEDESLTVEALGTDAVAHSSNGEFTVMRSDQAQLTVASRRGSVRVSAQGSSVEVNDGEQAVVAAGDKPGPVTKIPGSLFIKLSRLQQRKLRRPVTTVEGETVPGAIVSINGVETETRDGHFKVKIALQEGANAVEVEARDVLGRTNSQKVSGIVVDSRPPDIKGRVEW
jgi:hypothetical protein